MKRLRLICGLSAVLSLGVASAHAQVALQDEPRPSTVRLQETDEGVVFADSRGMTLYTGLDPKPNISTCTDEVRLKGAGNGGDLFYLPFQDRRPTCISKQPPALIGDGKAVGPWTVVNRADGLKQWAYNGKPLYTSIKDFAPGDANGIGFGQDVVTAEIYGDAGPVFAPTVLPPEVRIQRIGVVAQVLATNQGRTLYTYDLDTNGKSACEDRCALTWRPLLASMTAAQSGGWSVVVRADKSRQWAFKGKPLYTYADDRDPGDYGGNGRANWKVALAYPLPAMPPAITVTHTILGPRFADSRGLTLYTFMCMEPAGAGFEGTIELACDDPSDRSLWWTTTCGNEKNCADLWRPIIADKDAKPIGKTWTIVTLPELWAPVRAAHDSDPGVRVWAYKGRPVFTNKYETRPGQIDGEDMGELASQKFFSITAVGSDINRPSKTVLGQLEK